MPARQVAKCVKALLPKESHNLDEDHGTEDELGMITHHPTSIFCWEYNFIYHLEPVFFHQWHRETTPLNFPGATGLHSLVELLGASDATHGADLQRPGDLPTSSWVTASGLGRDWFWLPVEPENNAVEVWNLRDETWNSHEFTRNIDRWHIDWNLTLPWCCCSIRTFSVISFTCMLDQIITWSHFVKGLVGKLVTCSQRTPNYDPSPLKLSKVVPQRWLGDNFLARQPCAPAADAVAAGVLVRLGEHDGTWWNHFAWWNWNQIIL